MAKSRIVTATINGETVEFLCKPRDTLLDVLRETLCLTGTKEGCSNGNCGACTVLLDGRAVDSCPRRRTMRLLHSGLHHVCLCAAGV